MSSETLCFFNASVIENVAIYYPDGDLILPGQVFPMNLLYGVHPLYTYRPDNKLHITLSIAVSGDVGIIQKTEVDSSYYPDLQPADFDWFWWWRNK